MPVTNVSIQFVRMIISLLVRAARLHTGEACLSLSLSCTRARLFYYNIMRIYRQTVSSVPSHAFRTAETGGAPLRRVSSLTSLYVKERLIYSLIIGIFIVIAYTEYTCLLVNPFLSDFVVLSEAEARRRAFSSVDVRLTS